MKKIVFFVLIITVIVGYFVLRDNTPKNIETTTNDTVTTGHPDPANATFIFDEGSITLSKGRSEKAITPGSAFVEETSILDKFAYGDINADGKEDAVLFLANYGAGSGTFIYLAGYVSGPVTYRGTKVVFIGDRITPQSLSIDRGVVTVKYLDREADDAYAVEPTIPKTLQFIYKNGEFQEK